MDVVLSLSSKPNILTVVLHLVVLSSVSPAGGADGGDPQLCKPHLLQGFHIGLLF